MSLRCTRLMFFSRVRTLALSTDLLAVTVSLWIYFWNEWQLSMLKHCS